MSVGWAPCTLVRARTPPSYVAQVQAVWSVWGTGRGRGSGTPLSPSPALPARARSRTLLASESPLGAKAREIMGPRGLPRASEDSSTAFSTTRRSRSLRSCPWTWFRLERPGERPGGFTPRARGVNRSKGRRIAHGRSQRGAGRCPLVRDAHVRSRAARRDRRQHGSDDHQASADATLPKGVEPDATALLAHSRGCRGLGTLYRCSLAARCSLAGCLPRP
uniref:Uncharacterized protein n=1 Tax=uncultured marine group II/III euryarchaeote KM3_203_F09 TaxID=1456423 RepID=A0A075GZ58_9EURY|nr:hypothetical protein [uncultured marine group II/III euryarchaeote KM3_203_F09]